MSEQAAMVGAAHDAKTGWPVMEIFGPTIQGEGPQAGLPCQFIRLGGCDYRCSWCDTMDAVDPASVRTNSTRMSEGEIVAALDDDPEWIVISGGNPALFNLGRLVMKLHECGFKVAVETQGSRWKPWLATVDQLVISPKGPSSGMNSIKHTDETIEFMAQAEDACAELGTSVALKIVVFDDLDYTWAAGFFTNYNFALKFLSAGTDQLIPEHGKQPRVHDLKIKDLLLERYGWLCDKAKVDPAMGDVRILPQLHVLAWGTGKGV